MGHPVAAREEGRRRPEQTPPWDNLKAAVLMSMSAPSPRQPDWMFRKSWLITTIFVMSKSMFVIFVIQRALTGLG